MSSQDASAELHERSAERRRRMVAHRAAGFEDAEAWDLEFWQRQMPEERLSALVAIRRDVELAQAARRIDHPRHQEDVRVLRMVRERRKRQG